MGWTGQGRREGFELFRWVGVSPDKVGVSVLKAPRASTAGLSVLEVNFNFEFSGVSMPPLATGRCVAADPWLPPAYDCWAGMMVVSSPSKRQPTARAARLNGRSE